MFVGSSLVAFMISNLPTPLMAKTLGDAGSRLLGFIVVCLLLAASTAQVSGAGNHQASDSALFGGAATFRRYPLLLLVLLKQLTVHRRSDSLTPFAPAVGFPIDEL